MDSKFSLEHNIPVVFIGLVALDIIKFLNEYPVEDCSHRCYACKWRRGGNASNSATVFSLLGGKTRFFGTIANTDESQFLLKDFKKYNICFDDCPQISNATCPLSTVILSKSSATRTVLHTNVDLRELTLEDFKTHLDLKSNNIGWTHFEGRDNDYEISQMIRHVMDFNETYCDEENKNSTKVNRHIVISLEAEKSRFLPGMDKYNLWQLPDILFVSKDFAKNQGFLNMSEAAQGYFKKVRKGALVICAWGECGAAAMSQDEGLLTSSAYPPKEIVDTCGAGDTFNASVIRALSIGKSLQDSIVYGCKVAGAKCGLQGYDGVEQSC